MGNKILSRLRDNLSLKAIALAVAVLIWILVSNNSDPVRSILISNVPINIVNEDSIAGIGKVIDPQGSGTVTLRVTERSSVLRHLSRSGSDFYVEADLENINEMSTVPLTVTCSNIAVTWDEINLQPSSLKVTLEDKVEQAFAVTVSTSGNTPNGYAVGTTEIREGKTVLIAGPKSLMDIINQVVAPVAVSGINADADLISTLKIIDKNGAEFSEAQLSRLEFKDSSGNALSDRQVTVAVDLWKVVSDIAVTVRTSGRPKTGYRVVSVTTIPQTITLIGTDEALDEIGGSLMLEDALDVNDLSEDFSEELDLTETIGDHAGLKLPADADPVISVQVQFEKSGDKRVEIPMSEVVINNRPENMKLVLTPADILPVIVHPTEMSDPGDELKSSDFQVSLDLEVCREAGSYEIRAEVIPPDGYELSAEVTVTVTSVENTEGAPAPAETETGTEKGGTAALIKAADGNNA